MLKSKYLLAFAALFVSFTLLGNMASPLRIGSVGGQTFITRNVDVLQEEISIRPDSIFETAFIKVIYLIRSDSSGVSIPLVFHAENYGGGMQITFDDQLIDPLNYLPLPYNHLEALGLDTLSKEVVIKWDEDIYLHEGVEDLKYFELNISPGTHRIVITYTADAWVDRSDWVKERSIYYALAPLAYWKSAGEVKVNLDYSAIATFVDEVDVNLESPEEDDQAAQVRTWTLQGAEQALLALSYKPPLSKLSQFLIGLSPFGMACVVAIVLLLLHFWLIYRSKDQSSATRKWVLYAGVLSVSILVFAAFIYAYALIDYTLGPHASIYHGYVGLTIIFVPFGMILHAVIAYWYAKTLR